MESEIDCWVVVTHDSLLAMSKFVNEVFSRVQVVLARGDREIVSGKGIVNVTTHVSLGSGDLMVAIKG